MITKGTFPNVLAVCSRAETADGSGEHRRGTGYRSRTILRTSAARDSVCSGSPIGSRHPSSTITKDEEKEMIFLGFLVLLTPPKKTLAETIKPLQASWGLR